MSKNWDLPPHVPPPPPELAASETTRENWASKLDDFFCWIGSLFRRLRRSP